MIKSTFLRDLNELGLLWCCCNQNVAIVSSNLKPADCCGFIIVFLMTFIIMNISSRPSSTSAFHSTSRNRLILWLQSTTFNDNSFSTANKTWLFQCRYTFYPQILYFETSSVVFVTLWEPDRHNSRTDIGILWLRSHGNVGSLGRACFYQQIDLPQFCFAMQCSSPRTVASYNRDGGWLVQVTMGGVLTFWGVSTLSTLYDVK